MGTTFAHDNTNLFICVIEDKYIYSKNIFSYNFVFY